MSDDKLWITFPGSSRRYKAIKLPCLVCGKEILMRDEKDAYKRKHLCSKECRDSYNKIVYVNCATCGKQIRKTQSELNGSRHGIYFCSRKCKDDGQRIGGVKEIQPPHYGNISSDYRAIAYRSYEKVCKICGYKEYPEILQVHHIDENRNNNKVENLMVVCPNCHSKIHHKIIKI